MAVLYSEEGGTRDLSFVVLVPLSQSLHPDLREEAEFSNGTARVSDLCRKTTVLCCHRCLINTGVEKINNIQIYITVLPQEV
jgi:hypothetical protein